MSELTNALASKAFAGLDASREEEEALYAERLIRLLGVFDATITKRERPDFTVTFGGATIALEVTRYHADVTESGSEEARYFKLWTAFAEDLRQSLAAAGVGHIYGAIHFRETSRRQIPDRAALITEIAAAVAVASANGGLSDVGSLEAFDAQTQPSLHAHVQYIYLRNISPERGLAWWCAHLQSGEVPNAELGIRARVRVKDAAAESYHWPGADERWLLIYAAARGLSDFAHLTEPFDPPITSDQFTRVFLYDAFGQRVHQLHPAFLLIRDGRDLYVRRLPPIVPGSLAT